MIISKSIPWILDIARNLNRYYLPHNVVLTISNSSFDNNRAYQGGAVYYDGDEEVNINHSMFTNSNAGFGGAIYSRLAITLTHCNISGNTASVGVIASYSFTAENCIISGNIGGAVHSSSSVTAENCVISRNIGGAITSSSFVIINNSTVSGKTG